MLEPGAEDVGIERFGEGDDAAPVRCGHRLQGWHGVAVEKVDEQVSQQMDAGDGAAH